MKKGYIIVSIIFCFCSCSKSEFEKIIIGEWVYIETFFNPRDVDLASLIGDDVAPGYTFKENNICENKLGYFKRSDDNNFRSPLIFLGRETKYKIEGDSLAILSLFSNEWHVRKIHSLSRDSLTFINSDGDISLYTRVKNNTDNVDFEKIIISTSYCYGRCPSNNTLISRTGDILYYGEGYNTINGLYKGQIDIKIYNEIQQEFNKINIHNLEDKYIADWTDDWTDDQTITVTFIKDNKIYKTIEDYGRRAPTLFQWATIPLMYLYQKTVFDSIPNTVIENTYVHIHSLDGKKNLSLPKSESFYLKTLLMDGKTTNQQFVETYKLSYSTKEGKDTITTDGQFFNIKIDNQPIILDIGQNFFTNNNIEKLSE